MVLSGLYFVYKLSDVKWVIINSKIVKFNFLKWLAVMQIKKKEIKKDMKFKALNKSTYKENTYIL